MNPIPESEPAQRVGEPDEIENEAAKSAGEPRRKLFRARDEPLEGSLEELL
ncbi:MAG TPA: hypothetical protein VFV94_15000 [Polyangiaceae bacterium]|jgi:hypothetical protein|nr:hypothetical protein [Polyangiaceae bacterium]